MYSKTMQSACLQSGIYCTFIFTPLQEVGAKEEKREERDRWTEFVMERDWGEQGSRRCGYQMRDDGGWLGEGEEWLTTRKKVKEGEYS